MSRPKPRGTVLRFSMPRAILTGLTVAVLHAAAFAEPESGVIAGRILDADAADPVWLANVSLIGTKLGAATGRDGRFTIREVPPGTYTLRVSHVAYDEARVESVRVGGDAPVELNLLLTPRTVQLKEITVTPGAYSFMEHGAPTRQTMSREEIESVPQIGEDVFRAVNRLPGLSSGDYTAHFSIRGGRHDETLILLDGLEIYEPYHLKDFNEGAISIIDAETIDGIELMTGGFPAEYGNKRSGVFSITSRKPQPGPMRYSAGLSFMNARAMAQGTFAQDKGAWFVSGRRGYLDLVFRLMNQNDLPSPFYYDLFSKLRYDLHRNHSLAIDFLHAGDSYRFDAEATTGFQDSIKTREIANNTYGNSYAWITLSSVLGRRVATQSMLSAGRVTKDRDGTEKYLDRPGAIYDLTNNRGFNIFGLKQDWMLDLSRSVLLKGGIDLRRLETDYNLTSVVGQDPNDPSPDSTTYFPVTTRTTHRSDGTTLALHLSNRVQLIDPITVEFGIRHDRADYTNDSELSPRVNALLALGPKSSLRFGWGHYRQIHGIEDLAVLNGQNEYFPAELTKQWSAGFEQGFPNRAKMRVEGYYKVGSNLRPRYRNWKGSPDVFPETNEDRILVFPDRSVSKGIETYYEEEFGERLSVRGSYALSVVEEETAQIQNVNDATPLVFDPIHPGPQDQRHAVNVDFTYRPRDTWSINTSYAFHTGWPGTLEDAFPVTSDDGEPDFAIRPVKLYGSRLPAYQRVDMRATKRVCKWGGDLRFFVELINLTNHANVFGYDYFRETQSNGEIGLVRNQETWFTILPSVGASWTGSF